jgi:type II secretory pathway pseudopilin PulG
MQHRRHTCFQRVDQWYVRGAPVAVGCGVPERVNVVVRPAGTTLVEVLVAVALLAAISIGVVQLFGVAIASNRLSFDRTMAVALAAGKMEELRSLEWRYQASGSAPLAARTDLSTDLSIQPITAGGPGLAESPPGTLDASTPPYVDYLDRRGQWAGTGPSPSSGAVYIRRWAIHHWAGDPGRLLTFQVLVTTVARERLRPPLMPHAWNGHDVLLTTMMARRVR